MQKKVIEAVHQFSAISGLNVQKSAAIDIGCNRRETEEGDDEQLEDAGQTTMREEADTTVIEPTDTVRYLGHIAGSGDTAEEAWEKAFAALRVRLVLAEAKTNSVQQRAAIAAAIIIPKMLYVARHAWPTEDIVKKADLCIRHYVWKSKFSVPDSSPAGWIQSAVAGQNPRHGGIGRLGDILQTRDTGSADWLVPMKGTPKEETLDTIWATGRPWVELQLHEGQRHAHENGEELMEIRVALRASKGVTTRWTSAGLHGECRVDAIAEVPLQQIWLGNSQGIQHTWKECVKWLKMVRGLKAKDVLSFGIAEDGGVIFHPQTHSMPMESRVDQMFREVCLNKVANYPELLFNRPQQNVLQVKHKLEDLHHVFLLDRGNGEQIDHSWGSELTRLPWDRSQESAEQACARFLGVGELTVWIAPHPWLQRCMPIWAGKRRWTQNRKQYKKLMNKERRKAAEEALQQRKLEQGHEQVAKVLKRLSWTQIQRMEGVTPYQTQNIIQLKLNRLKMWAGAEQGYGCTVAGCKRDESRGTLHVAWTCKEAEEFWNMFLERGRLGTADSIGRDQERARAVPDIFGFKM
ncbi:unnamed protein product [Phytophthora fragariaefolia]|uniref:Unnamed protein product n=1 Tax=Phytophthora fragariaefolia TaxID=1490495 RepID=A0A9W6XH53_9STRA|nr:unnamed protein product [Phytophthora fragariaefolia]